MCTAVVAVVQIWLNHQCCLINLPCGSDITSHIFAAWCIGGSKQLTLEEIPYCIYVAHIDM